jgi:hypothetical protein
VVTFTFCVFYEPGTHCMVVWGGNTEYLDGVEENKLHVIAHIRTPKSWSSQ